jgi:hypothetical protein
MADGFTLQIDDEMARKIERAAKAAGLPAEEWAKLMLAQHLFSSDDYSWSDGGPREQLDATAWEDGAPWEEVRAEGVAAFNAKLRGRE